MTLNATMDEIIGNHTVGIGAADHTLSPWISHCDLGTISWEWSLVTANG